MALHGDLAPVVVVTHAGPSDRLRRCVTSLCASGGTDLVVVVDNSGRSMRTDPDDTVAEVARGVEVVTVETDNRGYGAAANVGFAEARQRRPAACSVALLNDDIEVSSEWLVPLRVALDAGWDVAQPKLLFASSEASDTPLVNSVGVRLDSRGAGVDIGHGEPDSSVFDGVAGIEIFTGGAVLFSTDFLDETGGFDERYFLYYEDVDLALRGRELGRRYACVPESVVWHEGGATTGQLGARTRRLQERNRLWCAFRFAPLPMLARAGWLSLRRLRHAPRRVHATALVTGVLGAPRALFARLRVPAAGRRRRTDPGAALGALPAGVNLLGYHGSTSGLGTAVRQLRRSLEAAGVPVSIFDVAATESPEAGTPAGAAGSTIVRATTIAVVTAPELPSALAARPKLRDAPRVVGYWFWEIAEVPDTHRPGMGVVDEIWAPTTFIADAYRSAPGAPPVVVQPLYLAGESADPALVDSWRARFAPNGEFVFLVALDLFSIVERKNPFGAVDAFASAFGATDANVRLVIKMLNGNQRPESSARIAEHIGSSGVADRIDLVDAFVSDAEMTALVAAADCLVSLHRGEGLGLHLAAAMWLETPVIASRYSGNLDFMSDDTSALIDVTLVGAEHGEGAYPDGAEWADPDIAQAAAWMRRLVAEPETGRELAAAALARMQEQPSEQALGARYAAALGDPATAAPAQQ